MCNPFILKYELVDNYTIRTSNPPLIKTPNLVSSSGESDYYSFGVVLLELLRVLTREKPMLTCFGEHRSLGAHFLLDMEVGRVMSIFDPMVVKEISKGDLLAIA